MKQLILTFTIFVLLYINLSAQLVPTSKGFGKCGYCKEGTKEFVVNAKYEALRVILSPTIDFNNISTVTSVRNQVADISTSIINNQTSISTIAELIQSEISALGVDYGDEKLVYNALLQFSNNGTKPADNSVFRSLASECTIEKGENVHFAKSLISLTEIESPMGISCSNLNLRSSEKVVKTSEIKIAPTVSEGLYMIEHNLNDQTITMQVYDLNGNLISTKQNISTISMLDLQTYAAGLYFVRIIDQSTGDVLKKKKICEILMTLSFKILLKYNILVCLLGLVYPSLVAQEKDDYVWLFNNGGKATSLDFGSGDVKFSLDTVLYENSAVNASVSDADGKLLFYTNGCQVIQSDHQLMENGDSLNYGRFYVEWWDNCAYGYNGFQDILILKDEMNEDIYYIIHKFINYETTPALKFWMQDMRYTMVDMSYNGGRGKVIKKNQVFHEQHSLVFSFLTAIKHSNNKYWWMIQMNKTNSTYYKYLLKEDGPMLQDSQQIGPSATPGTSAAGQAKFSPDGKMWAWFTNDNGLNLFDFDRTSGLLSNQRVLPIKHKRYFTGLEFSPNSRFIYLSMYDSLMQVDLWKEDLTQGVELIDTFKYQQDPFANFHLMTLAPDCKIYMGSTNSTQVLHRINKPNKKGKDCDFVQYDIDLLHYKGLGSVNYPRLRVDYEDVCDSLEEYSGLDIDVSAPLSRIKVWPNPITDISIIDCSYSGHLKVYNNNGLEVISKYLDHTLPNYLDLEGYPSGMYIVRLIDTNGRSSTIKVIKT